MPPSPATGAPPVNPTPLGAHHTDRVVRAPAAAVVAPSAVAALAKPGTLDGWISGLLGMFIFSGSLPATRVALEGFSPAFLTFSRASLAGLLALAVLLATRSRLPTRAHLSGLAAVAFGAVLGFPLFTGIALQAITSAQALVFIGLLPLSTALFGVLRTSERPSRWFWAYSVLGAGIIVAYATYQMIETAPAQHVGANSIGHAVLIGEAMMLFAIVVCGYAYAEGARLSRDLGGWQVICWALVLSLPLMLLAGWFGRPWGSGSAFAAINLSQMAPMLAPASAGAAGPSFAAWWTSVPLAAWLGLGYVSLFSMLIGFFFWYRGLAIGGIAAVGQLQLLQPFVGLLLAACVLGEAIQPSMLWISAAVVACVGLARRANTPRRG